MEQSQIEFGRNTRPAHPQRMLRRLHHLCRGQRTVQGASRRTGCQFTIFPVYPAGRSDGPLQYSGSRRPAV